MRKIVGVASALAFGLEPGAPVQVSGFEFGPREASKLGSVGKQASVYLDVYGCFSDSCSEFCE